MIYFHVNIITVINHQKDDLNIFLVQYIMDVHLQLDGKVYIRAVEKLLGSLALKRHGNTLWPTRRTSKGSLIGHE
jgi:hypothetical protein